MKPNEEREVLEERIFKKIKYYLNKQDLKKFKFYEGKLKILRYNSLYDDYGGSKQYYSDIYRSLPKK